MAIVGEQDLVPAGRFILPVCTTRDNLRKLLSILHFGIYEAGYGDDEAAITDVLNALAFLDDPVNSPCGAALIQSVPGGYPEGVEYDGDCLTIDMRQLRTTVNILQEAALYAENCSDFETPESWKVKPGDGGDMSSVDINNLQQQIDALESTANDLQQQLNAEVSARESAVSGLESGVSLNAQALNYYNRQRIGTVRWFGGQAPSGWLAFDGQTFDVSNVPNFPYAYLPAAWCDQTAQTVTLPLALAALPVGQNTTDSWWFGVARGSQTNFGVNFVANGDSIALALVGRWHIYLGEEAERA